mmetsp:Transcript_1570/g.3412  ORF Transcript_1570/g.3412 Transcript_1570/m.3412 type:complete len:97 (+) Transcript_1570:2311-2601(+)
MATKHHAGLLAAGVVISRHGPRFIVAYLKSEDPGIEPPFYLTVWEWHQNDQYSLVALAKGILSFCLQGHSSCMYIVLNALGIVMYQGMNISSVVRI